MRIARTRVTPVAEAPIRVRRTRAAPEEPPAPVRVRRVRVEAPEPLPAPSIVVITPNRGLKEKRKAWKASFDVHPKEIYVVDWARSHGSLFQLYMLASFLYYERDFSVLTDSDYDQICKILGKNFDKFDHPHKHLVAKEDFEATTGFAIRYPTVVKAAADYMQQRHYERKST